MKLTRRQFFGLSGSLLGAALIPKETYAITGKYATLIDLTKCDGCQGEKIPLCVKACREENKERFPEPKKPILPYWPRKTYEDWSNKREVIDTLTPYNWLFIQKVEIDRQTLYIPRRCMHCDSPPCVKGCPFGALTKQPEGNSVIDHNLCFGGAKCRDVCPWHIPQRQAGVGIYLKLLPKYAGGGVMYKCDLCDSRIKKGEEPACVIACKNKVFYFGERKKVFQMAYEKAKKEGLFVYGDVQNGGTSTLYLSPVPFEKVDQYLAQTKARFRMPVKVSNIYQQEINPIGKGVVAGAVIATLAGIAGALVTKSKEQSEKKEGNHGE
ncbi:4Fe-4S dicluster domain-containing protein [Thermodesulfobacterium sp. TA1]|uniref:4Fe-4S dicluster domain-containing protein n=1 Tax=Thermodesulfobacterium sp. TA1 TaxID=2234087 RepID=UPI0012321AD9|nr:4Fe-4S dicluster domain-containing protein [Thermodesulfobacterium sp. TA1]QER42545.1 4Fe-4S dicluster domain-containing protein [Thermodesulfobacterium sp. TA1]